MPGSGDPTLPIFFRPTFKSYTITATGMYDVWIAPGTFQNILTNQLMPVRAPDNARPRTGRCFMSRTANGEKQRVLAEVHMAST